MKNSKHPVISPIKKALSLNEVNISPIHQSSTKYPDIDEKNRENQIEYYKRLYIFLKEYIKNENGIFKNCDDQKIIFNNNYCCVYEAKCKINSEKKDVIVKIVINNYSNHNQYLEILKSKQDTFDLTRQMYIKGIGVEIYETQCVTTNNKIFGIIVMEKYDYSLSEYTLSIENKDYIKSLYNRAIELFKGVIKHGWYYLDMKPQNFVVKNKDIKMIDFDIDLCCKSLPDDYCLLSNYTIKEQINIFIDLSIIQFNICLNISNDNNEILKECPLSDNIIKNKEFYKDILNRILYTDDNYLKLREFDHNCHGITLYTYIKCYLKIKKCYKNFVDDKSIVDICIEKIINNL